MHSIDEDILSENEVEICLPYDEHTEKHVAWDKYRMDIIQASDIRRENKDIRDDK